MRAFFAIKMPAIIKEALLPEMEELEQRIPGGAKWIPPHQIHLTLKFLGEFDPKHLNDLQDQLEASCAHIPPIRLISNRLGVFPPGGKPRIIWFGIEKSAELGILYKNIESACEQFGYPREERSFSPHFTIGRVKRNAQGSDLENISEVIRSAKPPKPITFEIEAVTFFESTLTPTGPVYREQFAITLP